MTGTPGERDARFEREALACLPEVARFARSLTHDGPAADDLVQETFLQAYRGYATFREGSEVRRWLFGICHHVFLRTSERDKRVAPTATGDDAALETLAAVMGHVEAQRSGLDRFITTIDVGPAIRGAIDALPASFRAAVMLVDVEGMSYEEAADVLAIPIGTVRSQLFRGRRLLQESLFEYARDAGVLRPSSRPDRTTGESAV